MGWLKGVFNKKYNYWRKHFKLIIQLHQVTLAFILKERVMSCILMSSYYSHRYMFADDYETPFIIFSVLMCTYSSFLCVATFWSCNNNLVFPGPAVFCDGVHQRGRPYVSYPTYGQIQGATGRVRPLSSLSQRHWPHTEHLRPTLLTFSCSNVVKALACVTICNFAGFTLQRLLLVCFSCTERESSTGEWHHTDLRFLYC